MGGQNAIAPGADPAREIYGGIRMRYSGPYKRNEISGKAALILTEMSPIQTTTLTDAS